MCQAIAACDFGAFLPGFTDCFYLPAVAWLGRFLGVDLGRLALFMMLLFFLFAFLVVFLEKDQEKKEGTVSFGARTGLLCACLFFWSLISLTGVTQFLYSEF